METLPENTLTSFDLDLLLCPSNTSLPDIPDYDYQSQNISGSTNHGYQDQNNGITGTTDYSYQIQNIGITNQAYHEQNMRNELSLSDEVVKKSDYEAVNRQLGKLSADYASLQIDYESKNKDYDAVKKQYAKLASDYANLHEENKKHAMDSLNISTKCDTLEKKEVNYLATIDTLNKQCQKHSLDILAQNKQFLQYQSHVEDLMAEISKLKDNIKFEKNNGRDGRKMISTLTSNKQTLTEHLCLFACVIEGRKTLDKESRRLIKKYCKKITAGSKKSTETESFESHSIDTGRGSSLALSDSDRSFYSPSYSITSSPFSTGTTHLEQTKMIIDVSSSLPQMIKSATISTSPIIFEKGVSPGIKTSDVATNTMLTHEEITSVNKTKTIDIATSPIKFADIRSPLVRSRTLDIATSPADFADARSPLAMVRTFDIATNPVKFADARSFSPIEFADMKTARPKTLDIAISPVKFAVVRSPMTKAKTFDIATSPIKMADVSFSPIEFADTKTARVKTDIATSPVKFANVRSPMTKAKKIDIATSLIKFADARSFSPIEFTDTKTARAKTLDIATSPVKFADVRNPMTNAITIDIATSPIKFADARSLVAKATTLDSTTSPVKFTGEKSPKVKTKTLGIATSPIKFTETKNLVINIKSSEALVSPTLIDNSKSRVAKKKSLDVSSPVDNADEISPVVNRQTRPIKSLHMTIPINHAEEKSPMDVIKSPVPKSRSIERPDVRNSVRETKTPHISNSSIMENLKPIKSSKCNTYNNDDADSKTSKSQTNMNIITKKLQEIVSKHSGLPQDDTENDLEIKMILSKHTLSWNMLSPMSLSPELDQENEHSKPESHKTQEQSCLTSKKIIYKSSDSLIQSLRQSEDEYSGDDIANEDSHVDNLVLDLPQHVLNSDDAFDLLTSEGNAENDIIQHKNSTSRVENVVPESPTEVLNVNHAKSNKTGVTSTKYKKLTKLQKIYKANTPKSKIKNPVLLLEKHRTRPKLYSISPTKYSSTALSQNKEKEIKVAEFNVNKKQPFMKPNEIVDFCKESVKYINKEPESQSIDITDLPHNQTNPTQSDSNKRVATVKQSNSTNGIPPSSRLLRSDKQKRVCMSTKAQSNILSNPAPDQNTQTTERLTKSPLNSKYDISKVQTTKPESGPSLRLPTELPSENYSYPKQLNKRIARTKKDISESPVLPSNQADSKNNNKIINCTSDTVSHSNHGGCEESQLEMPAKAQSNILSILSHTQMNQAPDQTTPTTERLAESPSNSKYDISKVQTTKPESGPSLRLTTELPSENYSYPNPLNKRIARTRKHISENLVLPSNQANSKNSNEIINCTSDTVSRGNHGGCEVSQLKRPANDSVLNDLEMKRKRVLNVSQENTVKSLTNTEDSLNLNGSESGNKNGQKQSASLSIRKVHTPKSPDNSNIHESTKNISNDQTRHNADKMVAIKNYLSPKKRDGKIPNNWTHNILDSMIYKYGSNPGKLKKPIALDDDDVVATIIKTGIDQCVKSLPMEGEYEKTLRHIVDELKVHSKQRIIRGLVQFLKDPDRKTEFIPVSKGYKEYYKGPNASESEKSLIDLIELLEKSGIPLWDLVLDSAEHILFTLEKGATPCFDVIDSVAHFFALICRYRGNMSRLWMFMLNAMYCLSFKAIPILKHCFDVVPEVLPYANTYLEPGRAPLIRCFIFLLNFYTCEDRLKRVDEIRRRLKQKYYYNLQDENETTLLFLLKESIVNLTENKLDGEMLELSLLIVAKRKGTKWCHKNIVQKIILPMIKGEIEVSYIAKRFCITTIGYIMKPYNNEMTVHCEEVVNLLMRMFKESQPQEIKEDIIRGLINMDMKTIYDRLNTCLFNWNPPSVSLELEKALKMYVSSRNITFWLKTHQNYYREI